MRSALDKAKESATKVAEKDDESEKLEEFKAQCAAALEEAIKHKRLVEKTYKPKLEELKVQCAAALEEAINHKHSIEETYKPKLDELKVQCAAALDEANAHFKTIMDALDQEYTTALKAVEGGDESAKTKLAWLKLSGVGGAEKDEDGVAVLEERVNEGDDEAMWMLGVCNEYGIGTEQDIKRAVNLYKQSSERRNEIGMSFVDSGGCGRGSGEMGMDGLWIQIENKLFL